MIVFCIGSHDKCISPLLLSCALMAPTSFSSKVGASLHCYVKGGMRSSVSFQILTCNNLHCSE